MTASGDQAKAGAARPQGTLPGLRAAVIGGGIAGLSAALALARHGATVEVHEQAPDLRAFGAGIQLSPNGMRVLEALGLGAAIREVSRRSVAVQLRDASGAPVARIDHRRHRPDAQFRVIHRGRLIEVLARACAKAGVRVTLNDRREGPPQEAGLVVAADGLRSAMRAGLNGREVPFFTHQTAWRALIRDDGAAPAESQVFMAPGRHLVSYPLADGLHNIIAVEERHEWQDEGWSHPGDPSDLRAAFAGFGGPVPGWLESVEAVHLWGLFRHPIAPVWQDGRTVLIGDAAHPMLPFLAQGAVMALEDAWILAATLAARPEDQATALARFQAVRQPRVARVVAAANANATNFHLAGARRIVAHAGLRAVTRWAPGLLAARFDWLHDYDPVAVPH